MSTPFGRGERFRYRFQREHLARVKRKESERELRPDSVWWERMDSDHRSEDATDLQSAPFDHSGTLPYAV